jgi:hypothetical protein
MVNILSPAPAFTLEDREMIEETAGGAYVFDVTAALDTNAYADGDSMNAGSPGALLEVTGFVPETGVTRVLNSVVVNDKDDQGIGFEIFFFDRAVTLPNTNAAWNVSDADMSYCQGYVPVATADFDDLGGNRIAVIKNLGLPLRPNATSLFIALRSRGAGTYSAAGVTMKLGTV